VIHHGAVTPQFLDKDAVAQPLCTTQIAGILRQTQLKGGLFSDHFKHMRIAARRNDAWSALQANIRPPEFLLGDTLPDCNSTRLCHALGYKPNTGTNVMRRPSMTTFP
jgi:hypothetical protein